MKSTIAEMFPWPHRSPHTHNTNSHKSEMKHNSMTGKVNLESDRMMKGKVKHQNWQRKMTPLLRLDSEGEISTGNNFCSQALSNQLSKINNHLRLSNSFDSPCPTSAMAQSQESPQEFSVSRAGRPCKYFTDTDGYIPHQPSSFKKSFSEPNGLLAHQSFPPPSSTLSAIKRNLSCPMAEKLCSYSPNPRLLGSVDIFGVNNKCNRQDNRGAISPFLHENKNFMKRAISKKGTDDENVQIDDLKMQLDDSNALCQSLENMIGSKFSVVNGNNFPVLSDHDSSISNQNSAYKMTDMNCGDSSSQCLDDKDSSQILMLRKKKRKRCRNRRKRQQKQGDDSDITFEPASCSSPIKNSVKMNKSKEKKSLDSSSTPGVVNVKIVSPICHNKSENEEPSTQSQTTLTSPLNYSSLGFRLLCSDSEHSVEEEHISDDDLVFEDSVVFSEDTPSCSSISSSKSSLKKKKSKKANKSLEVSDESDTEQKNSSISGLHFTLSLAVSEDEENDSSVDWDTNTSPSDDQLIFEFEFNTGLCLDAILGQKASSADCAMSKKIRDLNMKWNECYASTKLLDCKSQQKVNFACDKDLVTIHFVGDEDRGGEWHRISMERARFQKKIDDIEKIVAPVLCTTHRAKVLDRMNV